MTREEAKKFAWESPNLKFDEIIDEIYDDFESRTCESCRFNENDKCGIRHGIFLMSNYGVEVNLDTFCCNQWETRDEKEN